MGNHLLAFILALLKRRLDFLWPLKISKAIYMYPLKGAFFVNKPNTMKGCVILSLRLRRAECKQMACLVLRGLQLP